MNIQTHSLTDIVLNLEESYILSHPTYVGVGTRPRHTHITTKKSIINIKFVKYDNVCHLAYLSFVTFIYLTPASEAREIVCA